MNGVLLEARSLRRAYDGQTVLAVDELELRRGEVLAVLGPNGSGKSTLFRLLLLIERADAGQIFFEGRAVRLGDKEARRRITGVFQRPVLFSGTVRDNIAFALAVNGVAAGERAERIASAASAFGLEPLLGAPVRTLSGGEAQRVALARAIAPRPDVLLLDEPTANLDALIKRAFREDVERAVRTHAGAVLLITHDAAEAFALADRIAVLDGGRIVQMGSPVDLLEAPATAFVASFTGAELLLDGVIAGIADKLLAVNVNGAIVSATLPVDRSWEPQAGMRVHVSYRPEDVIISAPDVHLEMSARNQYRLLIGAMVDAGSLVRLRLLGTPQLSALVTRESVATLGLQAGQQVIASMKATALRVLRSA
jgi:molybdopterin-binding protein